MNQKKNLVNWVCFGILAVMLVLTFLPYWHYEGGSASLSGYTWLPTNHEALESYFEATLGDYSIGKEFGATIIVTVLGLAALVLQIIFQSFPSCPIAAVVIGAAGLWGYTGSAVLSLGGMQTLLIILSVAALVFGVIGVIMKIADFISAK